MLIMQLNKIRKQTFAAFNSSTARNGNELMNDFKKHLEESLGLDDATILGIAPSMQGTETLLTIYFVYATPQVKKEKEKEKKKKKEKADA
jgi:hypothetical protein